jgi:hypothetical protein
LLFAFARPSPSTNKRLRIMKGYRRSEAAVNS